MSKTGIKNALRKVIQHDHKDMGPEGLLLAGVALLVCGEKISDYAQDVADFHAKFGISYQGPPRVLPDDVAHFRRKREIEELDEFEDERQANNIPGCFDAIIDEWYFLMGKAQLCGFTPAMLEEGWKRVHEANMKKVRATSEDPGKYTAEGCKQDIKKPPGWKPPFHHDIIGKAIQDWNAAHPTENV